VNLGHNHMILICLFFLLSFDVFHRRLCCVHMLVLISLWFNLTIFALCLIGKPDHQWIQKFVCLFAMISMTQFTMSSNQFFCCHSACSTQTLIFGTTNTNTIYKLTPKKTTLIQQAFCYPVNLRYLIGATI